jgi:transcriptional regulator with XRE-family HTH domain
MDRAQSPAFGDLLRRYRAAAGLTQEELAERGGVSARAIGDIERGVSQAPHRDTVRLLVEALGLSTDLRAAFESSARRRVARQPTGPPAPPLVGRTEELALVGRHLAGSGPPILVLAGEPGIGKTRLLAEARRHAVGRGWFVLEGGCQRRDSQEPFAPLLGALVSFLGRRTPSALHGDLRGCAWLVRLLPELAVTIGEALPSWTLPPEQERHLIFAAFARLLTNVARRNVPEDFGGLLLALDDLQWAGSDALELLTALVRPGLSTALSSEHRPLRVLGA